MGRLEWKKDTAELQVLPFGVMSDVNGFRAQRLQARRQTDLLQLNQPVHRVGLCRRRRQQHHRRRHRPRQILRNKIRRWAELHESQRPRQFLWYLTRIDAQRQYLYEQGFMGLRGQCLPQKVNAMNN